MLFRKKDLLEETLKKYATKLSSVEERIVRIIAADRDGILEIFLADSFNENQYITVPANESVLMEARNYKPYLVIFEATIAKDYTNLIKQAVELRREGFIKKIGIQGPFRYISPLKDLKTNDSPDINFIISKPLTYDKIRRLKEKMGSKEQTYFII